MKMAEVKRWRWSGGGGRERAEGNCMCVIALRATANCIPSQVAVGNQNAGDIYGQGCA